MALHHELRGSGPTVVFLHAGIVDSRMWDPQWDSFASRYRLLRCDLAGFGRSPIAGVPLTHAADVVGLLDVLGISGAGIVGASLGGRVALEVAVARPDLVGALVLAGAPLPDVDWTQAVRTYGAAEDEAVTRGDLDAATELNLRMWVDGPGRTAADVDPGVRAAVARMQRDALEMQAPVWDSLDEDPLVADLAARLGALATPTLVLVGEEDVEDMQGLARRFATEIPGARRATIAGAAHLPSLEQPAAFDELVLDFLAHALPSDITRA